MTNKLANVDQRTTGSQLLSNKGVSKIVDLGVFDAGDVKIAIKIGTNISDKESVARLSNKDAIVSTFGSNGQIFV